MVFDIPDHLSGMLLLFLEEPGTVRQCPQSTQYQNRHFDDVLLVHRNCILTIFYLGHKIRSPGFRRRLLFPIREQLQAEIYNLILMRRDVRHLKLYVEDIHAILMDFQAEISSEEELFR